MVRKMLFALGAILAEITAASAGVGECEFLLRQGIRDQLTVYENVKHERVDTSSLCSAKSEADYQGLAVYWAGIKLGYEQAKSMADAMCSASFSAATFAESNSLAKSVVSQSLMNTVTECIRVAAGGLDVQSEYALNDTHLRISMSFRPRGPGDATKEVTVKDIHLTGNIVCTGSIFTEWHGSGVAKIGIDNSDLFCDLRDNKDQIDISDTLTEVPGGLVEVTTTAGNISRALPAHHPHNRKLQEEFDVLKAKVEAFAADAVRIQSGQAKPSAPASDYISGGYVSFAVPFPEDFKTPEIVLTIDGIVTSGFRVGIHADNISNTGFQFVVESGMQAAEWGPFRVRYQAIAVRKQL